MFCCIFIILELVFEIFGFNLLIKEFKCIWWVKLLIFFWSCWIFFFIVLDNIILFWRVVLCLFFFFLGVFFLEILFFWWCFLCINCEYFFVKLFFVEVCCSFWLLGLKLVNFLCWIREMKVEIVRIMYYMINDGKKME